MPPIFNILLIFVLPAVLGLALRLLLRMFDKAHFLSLGLVVLTLATHVVVSLMPTHGSEAPALAAIMLTCFTAGCVVMEILSLARRKTQHV